MITLAASHSTLFLEQHSSASHLLLSSSSTSRCLSSSVHPFPSSFPPAPAAAPTQCFLSCSASPPLLSHEDSDRLQCKLAAFPLSRFTRITLRISFVVPPQVSLKQQKCNQRGASLRVRVRVRLQILLCPRKYIGFLSMFFFVYIDVYAFLSLLFTCSPSAMQTS